ncbi:hypothetical protein EDC04DRAFT_1259075 [Pisolithus marmoratus]|nr:hypothetical protein EDC04DRAFT_1259075 [Pisolithus marmoratus]
MYNLIGCTLPLSNPTGNYKMSGLLHSFIREAGNGKNPTTVGCVVSLVSSLFTLLDRVAMSCCKWWPSHFLLSSPANFFSVMHTTSYSGHQAIAYKLGMDPRMKISLYAMGFSTTCLFIRAIYWTVEWKSYLHTAIFQRTSWMAAWSFSLSSHSNLFYPGFLILPIQRRFHLLDTTPSYGKA